MHRPAPLRRTDTSPAAGPRARAPQDEFVDALESASKGIHDPVAKLRYLRGSLARYETTDRTVAAVPVGPVRRFLYRWLSLESLAYTVRTNAMGVPVPVDRSTRHALARGRAIVVGSALLLLGTIAVVLWTLPKPQPPESARVMAAAPAPAAANAPLPPVAEDLPALPAGVKPAAIWQVEKGATWEIYSNGLRIETQYAVSGDARRFRVFENGALAETVHTKPVGIVFHTSESDVWPLEEGYNDNLRQSSHNLMLYVQRNKLYNFLIDRFGRVFRIVREETKANHAGHSVWQDGGTIYLGLNHSFIGVSFETRWDGGRVLPITEAQLAASRNLTEWLRQVYDVAPEMCVTHGLVSVNPKKHLIAHHMDWARGFPFKAFGLPNQYERVSAAVALFGFDWDRDDFAKVMPEPWAGVREAERQLAAEAERQGKTVEEIRRQRRKLYDTWLSEHLRDQEAHQASTRTDPGPTKGPRGG